MDTLDLQQTPDSIAASTGGAFPLPVAPAVPAPAAAAAPIGPQGPRALGPRDAAFHPSYLRQMCQRLREEGHDADQVLAAGGLTLEALEQRERLVAFEPVRWALHAAQFAAGRSSIGLELGLAAPLSAHGCLGYAVAAAPTMRRSLAALERFYALRSRAVRLHLEELPGLVRVHLEPGFDLADVRRFLLDHALGALLRLLHDAGGRALGSVTVHVPTPAPAWRRTYERFGNRVFFESRSLAVDLPAALLDAPTAGGSAAEFEVAWRECEAAEFRQRAALTFSGRVTELLSLEGETPELEPVARRLCMSGRTLIRRLAAEGTSFQALRETWRRQRALQLLRDPGVPIADIATRLGYSDGSNFSRTFRRWFGVVPADVRFGKAGWPTMG